MTLTFDRPTLKQSQASSPPVLTIHQVSCQYHEPKSSKSPETKFLFLVTVTLTFDRPTSKAIQSELSTCSYYTPSFMSIPWTELKLIAGNQISFFSNSDLDLLQTDPKSNPKQALHMFLLYTKFHVNTMNRTKVNRRKPSSLTPARPTTHPIVITCCCFSKTWLTSSLMVNIFWNCSYKALKCNGAKKTVQTL